MIPVAQVIDQAVAQWSYYGRQAIDQSHKPKNSPPRSVGENLLTKARPTAWLAPIARPIIIPASHISAGLLANKATITATIQMNRVIASVGLIPCGLVNARK